MNRDSILIVDDNFGIRELLNSLFSTEGYTVLTASSGSDALSLATKHLPDLVITDLRMPGMDGLELREKLKNLRQDIIVVIMSAYTDQALISEIINRGEFDGAISKPFDIKHLLMVVKNLLYKNSSPRKLGS